MQEIETLLDKTLKQCQKDKHSRYLSWEHCYIFFKENGTKILKDENLLDLASLNLAFYLASWGMYRGSSRLLGKDYKVHRNVIESLLENCLDLWNSDVKWEQIEKANEIIVNSYKENDISPTNTLKSKILMGIFACTVAYDRNVRSGLVKYKEFEHSERGITFYTQKSFTLIKNLSEKLQERTLLLNSKIKFPPMKLMDMYFWEMGQDEADKGKKK